MALPNGDWLDKAKRLPVGGKARSRHLHERRPNLTVGHDSDRYWAYCQACKVGAFVMKEHVRITGRQAPAESALLTLPNDMMRVIDHDPAVQAGVLGFLASKNMDAQYLPELWFSKARCRIMLMHGCEWLGRDTTERSPQKWLTFNASNHLRHSAAGRVAVIVEDPFSFYKVAWALRESPSINVFSSLGTAMSDQLMLLLLQYEHVLFFYDGDAAGHKGAAKESHRLRAMGIKSEARCAPDGMDPKDMAVLAIQQHVRS